ncbi:hypothetical protein EXIGLDRAFT_770018 [Exidia glandulosa HHB12029]|uniref:Uncharacterized protein n=1 Tax=Exidia glandulosa HHB12029 TaxID=1314781 RepID=A0A165H0Z1_EXIGL|nr:hypothetical protein EXIGLDRAFT_770018 [Exidia glandulosa HHB12029]
MEYDAYDALLHHIYKQTQHDAPSKSSAPTGACLRIASHQFRSFPDTPLLAPFEAAVEVLNPEVAVSIRTASVHAALGRVALDANSLFIDAENRIQILRNMSELARAEKGQGAAFIRDERLLVVWSDRVEDIIEEVKNFDSLLLNLVWQARPRSAFIGSALGESLASSASSAVGIVAATPSGASSVRQLVGADPEKLGAGSGKESALASKESIGIDELERGGPAARPVRLYAPVYNGLSTALSLYFVCTGVEKLIAAWALDGGLARFALCITLPMLFCIAIFFCMTLVTNIAFLFGPIAQYHQNSKYYSAVAPSAPSSALGKERLPHVTIQMPVYKEGLDAVIRPTVDSLQKAMLTYARQGGTSSIFINDDGMQLIDPEERLARQAFYENRGIGWVARPGHNKDGFIRAGRFKKASNMNFCLSVALRMEEILVELADAANKEYDRLALGLPSPTGSILLPAPASGPSSDPSTPPTTSTQPSTPTTPRVHFAPSASTYLGMDEGQLAERALEMACEETGGKAWGRGGRAIKMGEIILIVDSDTLVPEDCLRDAAREMAESQEVAIIQHVSDAMQVAHHYFENGISYFTRRINHAISVACSNGEIAPFVGHNAFLRWSAVQEAAFIDSADGKRKFWSESHVSEDFDIALRLQLTGYTIRWATYSHGGFKEGVSLTVDDELNRWQKYAYGCSELMFNPIRYWFTRGPITKQFHKFIWSAVPIHYKISMMAYMFSYYAIASALPLSILNYVALGFQIRLEEFYSHSWELWIACTVVFLGAGNIGFSVLEYRLNQKNLLDSFFNNIKWLPFFFFFFGGLSLSLSGAILAHLVSYNIGWTSTIKEVEKSNFFKEVPRIFKRFWATFLICGLIVVAMIILSTNLVPRGFHVGAEGWSVIFPLALQTGSHILFPIVLNPWLMIFSY